MHIIKINHNSKISRNIDVFLIAGCGVEIIIYGYVNSYAQTYAEENGINFVALDSNVLGDADGKVDVSDVI